MEQRSTTLSPNLKGIFNVRPCFEQGLSKTLLFRLLANASHGHLVIKEQRRVVAQFGQAGDLPAAEITVRHAGFYRRMMLGGGCAAGEAFVDGWWESPDLTSVVCFFARNLAMVDQWERCISWLRKPLRQARKLARMNTRRQAKRNILQHYDLGNAFYALFLDERMQYSSALFEQAGDALAQAQAHKLNRICRKLELSAQDHLLEVGGGWGGLAIFAARHYGCRVTTTTISDAQYRYARQAIDRAGLSDQIELLNCDYRELEGHYDKIVSVEMIEAVGERYLPGYFRQLNRLLRPGGLLMLQAITIADQRYRSYRQGEDFIQKHIFPGGFLPCLSVLTAQLARYTRMGIRDVRDMGLDYARTLAAWRDNLLAQREALAPLGFDETFLRLWLFYLGYCEGGFLERRVSAVQLLAAKAES